MPKQRAKTRPRKTKPGKEHAACPPGAKVDASLADGVFVGTCESCRHVVRGACLECRKEVVLTPEGWRHKDGRARHPPKGWVFFPVAPVGRRRA